MSDGKAESYSETTITLGFYKESPPVRFRKDWDEHPKSSLYFEAVFLMLQPMMPVGWWVSGDETTAVTKGPFPVKHSDDTFHGKYSTLTIKTFDNQNKQVIKDSEDFVHKMLMIINKYCGISWYIGGITTISHPMRSNKNKRKLVPEVTRL